MGRRLRFNLRSRSSWVEAIEGPIRRWPVFQEERRRPVRQEEEVYQE